jgi:predicted Ser/Thr protein kinase
MSGSQAPRLLGHYEIVSPLGAGGMGTVYKGRDTRLDRTVAIKLLSGEFSHRFQREARAISSLNHPHICTLYDIGHDGDTPYLVMEYVDGQPLACPVPWPRAIGQAIQIAEAMAAAHRQGIVHRDLKPANVLVTGTGVKVLDFGLAQVQPPVPELGHHATASLTAQGTVLGSLHYMAPEQLEGRPADARTDIYALGLVLYELITGRRAHEGRSSAEVIAVTMLDAVPLVREIRPEVPEAVERIVSRCLQKDPAHRWQTMEALGEALRWVRDSSTSVAQPVGATTPPRAKGRPWMRVVGAMALAGAGLALGWAWSAQRLGPVPARMVTDLDMPPELGAPFDSVFEIAPDGQWLVFNSQQALWLRSFTDGSVRRLSGTAGGTLPFWSPDSRSIGFFADGRLQRLTLPDGSPSVLADAPNPRGGAWGRNGQIVFAPSAEGVLRRVAERGGAVTEATRLDEAREEVRHSWPYYLPGRDRFTYVSESRRSDMNAIRIGGGTPGDASDPVGSQVSQRGAIAGRIGTDTYLLLVYERELLAYRFDEGRNAVLGAPETLARRARAPISLSSTGALVYVADPAVRNRPVWVDATGQVVGEAAEVGSYADLGVSRDGQRIAYSRSVEGGSAKGLWVHDLATGNMTRLPIDGEPDDPVWSPDLRRLAMSWKSRGIDEEDVYVVDLASPDQPRRLLTAATGRWPLDWSPDGRLVLYAEVSPVTKYDLWVAPIDGGVAPTPIVRSPGKDHGARFSPDGRMIAYQSDESGLTRVYVTPFPPDPSGTILVSEGGGNQPRWDPDGTRLYYVAPSRDLMMAAIVRRDGRLAAGKPSRLFTVSGRVEKFAGDRYLMLRDESQPGPTPIHVLTGWAGSRPR